MLFTLEAPAARGAYSHTHTGQQRQGWQEATGCRAFLSQCVAHRGDDFAHIGRSAQRRRVLDEYTRRNGSSLEELRMVWIGRVPWMCCMQVHVCACLPSGHCTRYTYHTLVRTRPATLRTLTPFLPAGGLPLRAQPSPLAALSAGSARQMTTPL